MTADAPTPPWMVWSYWLTEVGTLLRYREAGGLTERWSGTAWEPVPSIARQVHYGDLYVREITAEEAQRRMTPRA